jgi:acylphosphatase
VTPLYDRYDVDGRARLARDGRFVLEFDDEQICREFIHYARGQSLSGSAPMVIDIGHPTRRFRDMAKQQYEQFGDIRGRSVIVQGLPTFYKVEQIHGHIEELGFKLVSPFPSRDDAPNPNIALRMPYAPDSVLSHVSLRLIMCLFCSALRSVGFLFCLENASEAHRLVRRVHGSKPNWWRLDGEYRLRAHVVY